MSRAASASITDLLSVGAVIWRPVEYRNDNPDSQPRLAEVSQVVTETGSVMMRVNARGYEMEAVPASASRVVGLTLFLQPPPPNWTHVIVTAVRPTSLMGVAESMGETDYLAFRRHLRDVLHDNTFPGCSLSADELFRLTQAVGLPQSLSTARRQALRFLFTSDAAPQAVSA